MYRRENNNAQHQDICDNITDEQSDVFTKLSDQLHSAQEKENDRNRTVVIKVSAASDKQTVKKFIQYIVPSSLMFEFRDLKEECTDGKKYMVCSITASDDKVAIEIVDGINTGSPDTLVHAYIESQDNEKPDMNQMEKSTFVEKQWAELENKIERELEKHQDKIEKVTNELADSFPKNRNIPIKQFACLTEKYEALDSKLEEMKAQKREFISFVSSLRRRIHGTVESIDIKHQITELRKAFGRECNRLHGSLPIYGKRKHILQSTKESQVSVVIGETGSGKSTQMVQYLYESGCANAGLIVCTQPRKVAAQSLAQRVSQEMGSNVGQLVGFKVGMHSQMSKNTAILYVTDHVLLNECIQDPSLRKYSCVIIDEAHERSIFTDLLIGMIKRCLDVRSELKVIITSATIDPEVFVKYFGDCPVLKVSGRLFPVDIVWKSSSVQRNNDHVAEAVKQVKCIHHQELQGDILVFLTTPLETEKACEILEADQGLRGQIQCLPLHGRLQSQDQQKVFDPPPQGKRKVIFATNSAETSITIPGIRYVVDSGLVKERQYDAKRNMSSLVITSINRSSAEQRKGRAGRTQSGICFRMYTEEEYNAMEPMAVPEILRVHLGIALMKLMELGITDPLSFGFLQSPSCDALHSAMSMLEELGAVQHQTLTDIGKQMAKLSIEPRLSKLIFRGVEDGIGHECLAIATMTSVGSNVFFRMGNDDEKQQADKLKMRFCNLTGDAMSMLSVYKEWYMIPERARNKWCKDNSINAKAMRIARDTLNEIKDTMSKDLKMKVDLNFAREEEVTSKLPKIILQCYAANITIYSGHKRLGYFLSRACDVESLVMHPSSSLNFMGSTPKLVVYEQVLKTSQNFMMTVTPVEEEWIDALPNGHAIKATLDKLKELVMHPKIVAELGSKSMKKLMENRCELLKHVESTTCKQLGTSHVILDLIRDKGVIKCFIRNDQHNEVKTMIDECLMETKLKLKEASQEVPVVTGSSVRIVLGLGGRMQQMLMPNEYRTVILHQVPSTYQRDAIRETFQEINLFVADVIDITPRRPTQGGLTTKIFKVVFKSVEDATAAVAGGHADFVVRPDRTNRGETNKDEFKVKFTWNRRQARGIAFVQLKSVEDAQIVVGRHNFMHIGNQEAIVKISNKDAAQLFLTRLDKNVTQEEIRDAVTQYVSNDDIENISIPRENVGSISKMQMQAIQAQLAMKIRQVIDNDNFNVHVREPWDTTVVFQAFATFNEPQDGVLVVEEMDNQVSIQGKVVEAKADLYAALHVKKDIFGVLEESIKEVLRKYGDDVEHSTKQLKHGNYVLDIHTTTIEDLLGVKNELQSLLSGKILQCNSPDMFCNLTSLVAKKEVDRVMKQTKTLIQTDRRINTVTVYGSKTATENALMALDDYMQRTKDTTTKGIKLLCGNHPPGVMRELVVKYGPNLDGLRQGSQAYMLDLDVRHHVLKATASSKAHAQLLEMVQKISEELALRCAVRHVDDDVEIDDCSVCFCSIDEDLYRLEYCGHAYCKVCIISLVTYAITSKDFPLRCAKEGCDECLVVQDIYTLTSSEAKTQLSLSAIDHFMATHTEYKYCITVNCPIFYKKTVKQESFNCPQCHMSICTACHVQNHSGFSCDMNKQSKGDVDYGLREYLKKDRKNRAPCPKCGTLIEKNGGCNHMECIMCKVHICWTCKRTFNNEADTYNHMSKCAGIFDM